MDRVIEVDTKALRHGLMSGETLRAPRQQLRLLRTSGLCLFAQILNKTPLLYRFTNRFDDLEIARPSEADHCEFVTIG